MATASMKRLGVVDRHLGPKEEIAGAARMAGGNLTKNAVEVAGGVPRTGLVRLERLYAALELRDLRTPPGNRFEPLHGDREGQYSIRINDQWRICFNWSDERREAYNIEIADYH